MRRKSVTELNQIGFGSSNTASSTEQAKANQARQSNEPILDLNSVLRGNKVKIVTGEDGVSEAYSLVVRVLDKTRSVKGMDLRTAITSIAPKSHPMHAPVTALAEYVASPPAITEAALLETGKKMVRKVAVSNQENGRREFSSVHVAEALLTQQMNIEGMTMWLHMNKEDAGLPLVKTLEAQTELAPAQYQFKHCLLYTSPSPRDS